MADSMIQNLLKTPRQIREEQLQKMRNEAAGRAQLGGPIRGASSALPGIFSSVLQQQRPALATDIAQTARGLTQGLGGMLGAAGYQQAGQALAQATVTPEERQAAQLQQAIRGYQPGNLQSMKATYEQLKAANAPPQLLMQISEQIQQQEGVVRQQMQEQQAQSAAVEYVSRFSPELGELVASNAMTPKDAIEAVRKAQEPIKVGDVLVNVDPQTKKASTVFDARQRQPNTRYEILTPAEKTQLGLPEGIQYQRNATTGQITKISGASLPQLGNIPVGYQVVVDTDAQNRPLISMQPIPGSPQEQELKQSQEAVRAGKQGRATKYNQIVAPSIDLAIEIAEDPKNWATGKGGAFVEQLGRLSGGIISAETSRLALTEQLTTIRANIGFDRLQKMRDESPTGGALGQVALQELYALQSSIAPLNPNMKSSELVSSLKKVKETYRKAVEAIANDLTDEQLLQEGLGDLIPFRTATRNDDGSYTPLQPAEEPEFDISVLPKDIQEGWDNLDPATKQTLVEAYK
tara:strand:- start:3501 stop:5060 length:1560 start_codon:yes stop_codon:yes gene_type:complete